MAVDSSDRLYASAFLFTGTGFMGTVFTSDNNGVSWTETATGLTEVYPQTLAINSNNDVILGTSTGVFVPQSGSSSWAEMSTGLTNTDIRAFALGNNGYLYAGSNGGGIFKNSSFLGLDSQVVQTDIGLGQNVPNPCTTITHIPFTLDNQVNVVLKVYDALGREMLMLGPQMMGKGNHSFTLDVSNWKPGLYFYTLYVNGKYATKKMLVNHR